MKYEHKKLTMDDIKVRSYGFAKEYGELTGYDPQVDLKVIDDASVDLIQSLQDSVKKYTNKYTEDFELYCICEMAIEYLKIKEKEKENVKSANCD